MNENKNSLSKQLTVLGYGTCLLENLKYFKSKAMLLSARVKIERKRVLL